MRSNRKPAEETRSKFGRYRDRKRAQGLKLVRIWVPDPSAPGFAEEVARQTALISGSPESEEALQFLEAIEAEDGWPE